MKKQGILNYRIEEFIARIGHTQTMVICDPGLPIPPECEVIDISLLPGQPSFISVLSAVADEMKIESFVYASEIEKVNQEVFSQMKEILSGLPSSSVPHEEFKRMTHDALVFIRTGECSSYANVILVAGVTF